MPVSTSTTWMTPRRRPGSGRRACVPSGDRLAQSPSTGASDRPASPGRQRRRRRSRFAGVGPPRKTISRSAGPERHVFEAVGSPWTSIRSARRSRRPRTTWMDGTVPPTLGRTRRPAIRRWTTATLSEPDPLPFVQRRRVSARTPVPSAFATMSIGSSRPATIGDGLVSRRKTTFVPSARARADGRPPRRVTSDAVAPVAGSRAWMSLIGSAVHDHAVRAQVRTAAGADAAESRRQRGGHADERSRGRGSRAASRRPSGPGLKRSVVCTGSHLSRLDHAGRWRSVRVRRRTASRVSGTWCSASP